MRGAVLAQGRLGVLLHDAVSAHLVWKVQLERAIRCERIPRMDLTSAKVRAVDLCELGKWILRAAPELGSQPAFQELMRAHAEFHEHAADVLERLERGDKGGARSLLAGPIQAASRAIVAALFAFKDRRDGEVTSLSPRASA